MKNHFLQVNDNTFTLTVPFNPKQIQNKLPPAVYRVTLDDDGNIFLNKDRDRFTLPTKIYGNQEKDVDFMMSVWKKRKQKSTGLFLSGRKGSGKSLISEQIGNQFIDLSLPVFYITTRIPVQAMYRVLRTVGPCCVIFEEFFKTFKDNEHETYLNFFSDTELKQMFFIVSDNNTNYNGQHYRGRPGRFFFAVEFDKLRRHVIDDIAKEYSLSPVIHKLIHDWNDIPTDDGLNLDKLLLIAPLLSLAQSLDDFYECLRLYNVRPLPLITWNFVSMEKIGKTFSKIAPTKAILDNGVVTVCIDNTTSITFSLDDMVESSTVSVGYKLSFIYVYEHEKKYRIMINKDIICSMDTPIDPDKSFVTFNLLDKQDQHKTQYLLQGRRANNSQHIDF